MRIAVAASCGAAWVDEQHADARDPAKMLRGGRPCPPNAWRRVTSRRAPALRAGLQRAVDAGSVRRSSYVVEGEIFWGRHRLFGLPAVADSTWRGAGTHESRPRGWFRLRGSCGAAASDALTQVALDVLRQLRTSTPEPALVTLQLGVGVDQRALDLVLQAVPLMCSPDPLGHLGVRQRRLPMIAAGRRSVIGLRNAAFGGLAEPSCAAASSAGALFGRMASSPGLLARGLCAGAASWPGPSPPPSLAFSLAVAGVDSLHQKFGLMCLDGRGPRGTSFHSTACGAEWCRHRFTARLVAR